MDGVNHGKEREYLGCLARGWHLFPARHYREYLGCLAPISVSKDHAWRESLQACLGDEALDLSAAAKRKQKAVGGDTLPMGLGDFFFDPDDPLHPDDS